MPLHSSDPPFTRPLPEQRARADGLLRTRIEPVELKARLVTAAEMSEIIGFNLI